MVSKIFRTLLKSVLFRIQYLKKSQLCAFEEPKEKKSTIKNPKSKSGIEFESPLIKSLNITSEEFSFSFELSFFNQ